MANSTLSVAIVCKNAARTIRRTLESVRGLAGEVVALDSGSTDATLGILEEFGATAHHVQWKGFAGTKNEALDRCAGDWVLHLDADESLTPELRASVGRALGENDPGIAAYEVNRKVWWGGMLHHVWQPEWRLRLARRDSARWGGYEPHASLSLVAGASGAPSPRGARLADARRIARLTGDLRHDAFESMEEFLAKQVGYSRQGAESYLRMGRRASVLSLLASPVSAWCKQVIVKQAWRDGWRGMACASAVATAALMKHAVLLELQSAGRGGQGSGRPEMLAAQRSPRSAPDAERGAQGGSAVQPSASATRHG